MRVSFLFLVALFFPFFVNADVVINEIAWMGTENSASDEWIELFSSNGEDINGWTLYAADGGMTITLSGTIPASGFYLIERTDDTTVPNVSADLITPFGNGLSNAGETLVLEDAEGSEIDRINASEGWPAGDKTTKETMQWTGSAWITAAGTPKAKNKEAASEESEENTPSSQNTSSAEEDTSFTTAPIDKKQFRADAGGDKTAVVGVDMRFEGRGYGTNGDILTNADFLWNFGDGSMERGRNVSHVFRYPGTYRVVFDVSSGAYNGSDTIIVTAIPSPISISEVKPGTRGFIELWNDSEYDINISYWGIGNGKFIYYFPRDTFVLPRNYLVIPYDVSGIEFPSFGTASLVYVNGKTASALAYGAVPKADESFHSVGNISRLGVESPGSGRFVARVAPPTHYEPGTVPTGRQGMNYAIDRNDEIKTGNNGLGVEAAEGENVAVGELNQSASPILSERASYRGFWFWFIAAIFIGILSAGGVFAIRRLN